ncbi:hypothetical protein ACHAPT_011810 [Fusarium lateritium]
MVKLNVATTLALNVLALASSHPPDNKGLQRELGCKVNKFPETAILDGQRLLNAKIALSVRETSTALALHSLIEQADSWLELGPWAVTSKKEAGPSGSKHDYVSQGPYWWPSNSEDKCPFEFRDGQRNPELEKWPDASNSFKMMQSSYILSLAWYYTGNKAYAKHASLILKTWFLNRLTRMTPHMEYAQMVPCDGQSNHGYGGIIEFSQAYSSVLDAVAILSDSEAPGWSSSNTRDFKKWNKEFLSWFINSENGKKASAATNNHGTFYKMNTASIAYFVKDSKTARKLLLELRDTIDHDIAANGTQPSELWRSRPWHYSNFNLVAFTRAAELGKKVDVDIWGYVGSDGQSVLKAIEFLIPAAVRGKDAWPYKDMGFDAYAATDNIHAAADQGSKLALEVLASGKVEKPPRGDLWALRPAVEQLDALQD